MNKLYQCIFSLINHSVRETYPKLGRWHRFPVYLRVEIDLKRVTTLFCRLLEIVIRSAMMSFCSENLISATVHLDLGIDVDAYYNYLTLLMIGH